MLKFFSFDFRKWKEHKHFMYALAARTEHCRSRASFFSLVFKFQLKPKIWPQSYINIGNVFTNTLRLTGLRPLTAWSINSIKCKVSTASVNLNVGYRLPLDGDEAVLFFTFKIFLSPALWIKDLTVCSRLVWLRTWLNQPSHCWNSPVDDPFLLFLSITPRK